MKTLHKNFTDADQLEVSCQVHETCGPLVHLIQRAGSLSFQHSMTPAQAREMANALLDCVEELEPVNEAQIKLLEAAK